MTSSFDQQFREWACAACAEWKFPEPPEEFYKGVARRLPVGLRQCLSEGLDEGLVIPTGRTFKLKGLPPRKKPYAWFDRNAPAQRPDPNWEYYVQVSEFVRLHRIAGLLGLTLAFEDHLMDLALYRDQKLLVCVEVKERAEQLEPLAREIRRYEAAIDPSVPGRGNDPLRKAKYIVTRRPDFFCLVAIGLRLEFRVEYPPRKAFELVPDVVPWS